MYDLREEDIRILGMALLRSDIINKEFVERVLRKAEVFILLRKLSGLQDFVVGGIDSMAD